MGGRYGGVWGEVWAGYYVRVAVVYGSVSRGGKAEQTFRAQMLQTPQLAHLLGRLAAGLHIEANEHALVMRVIGKQAYDNMVAEGNTRSGL